MVFSVMYLVTVTAFFCVSRSARPIAWDSLEGFHCGSSICTCVAMERLRLQVFISNCNCKKFEMAYYPTAPVPVVMRIILIAGSVWNVFTIEARVDPETLPSIRVNDRLLERNNGSKRSSVDLQQEKTILLFR